MSRPNLTVEQVQTLVPSASDIQYVDGGGQKQVFKGKIGGEYYAIKLARAGGGTDDIADVIAGEAMARARREVETMRDCDSPYVVKLGPIGLELADVAPDHILYFTEELIDGRDLFKLFKADGPFSQTDVIKLGIQIGSGVRSLWDLGKVHRDIKPLNIMRRSANGDYVLLDAGLAFDVQGESLSFGPVGTQMYFSPEQFQFNDRRTVLDFRSDLFSLGVTMYELVTGRHPFWVRGDMSQANWMRIISEPAPPMRSIRPELSEDFCEVVEQLLGKSPHLRFRTCDKFLDALGQL